MRSLVGAALLATFCVPLDAGVSRIGSHQARHASVFRCPSTPGTGGIVGTIANVLHSKVYVDGKYVGTTPFPLHSGSRICTDNTGEVIFNLARSKRSLVCIGLPLTVVQVTPKTSLTAALEKGRTWCSIGPTEGSFSVPIARLSIKASPTTQKTQTLVGVTVVPNHTARIAVYQGSISLKRYWGKVRAMRNATVSSRQQAVVRSDGQIARRLFKPSSEELVVIAQLRLARPTPR